MKYYVLVGKLKIFAVDLKGILNEENWKNSKMK